MKLFFPAKILLTALITLFIIGCGKNVEINLDEKVDICEISWQNPEGWTTKSTSETKLPFFIQGPDEKVISVMHYRPSPGMDGIWNITRAWRKTLGLPELTKAELKRSLSFLENNVVFYQNDNGKRGYLGAFYSQGGSLWIFRMEDSLDRLDEQMFRDFASTLSENNALKDRIEALKDMKDVRAYLELADYYAMGKGVDKDEKELEIYLEKARANGSEEASYKLALLALKNKDAVKAVKLLHEAVKKKHVDATLKLAEIVLSNNKDHEFALQLFEDAAKLGSLQGMHLLGTILFETASKDEKKAVMWIEKAVAKDYAPAIRTLGDFHLSGFGFPENLEKAVEYYEKAAAKKDMVAMESLAQIFLDGKRVKKDIPKAVGYLLDASSLGSTRSLIKLSSMYFRGDGVKKNNDKGFKLLEAAVREGSVEAMIMMGNMFYLGMFTVKNYKMSFRFYKLAAEHGDSEGMFKLGQSLMLGKGCEIDEKKAVEWLKKSAAQGHTEAKLLLRDKKL